MLIAGLAVAALVLVGIATAAYARYVEPRWLDITKLDVDPASWPAELDGVKFGVVGDIHVGLRRGRPWTSPALDRAVAATNRENLDALLLVGDYGYMQWDPDELATVVDRFKATNRIAVMGNHDWARGTKRMSRLSDALAEKGITVLINDAVEMSLRSKSVIFLGLGDLHAHTVDVDRMVSRTPQRDGPRILLSHSPDAVALVPTAAYDLAVAGHTHGCQIALPFLQEFILRRFANSRFNRGLYQVEAAGAAGMALRPSTPNSGPLLFVTRGIGMVGRRARFRSRPEVAILTVRSPNR